MLQGVQERLLPRVIVVWQMVHPEKALLLRVVSIPCHEDVISSVLPGIQDDCKVTAKKMT
jgi:hypothetical protein